MKNRKIKGVLIVFSLFAVTSVYPQATADMLEKAYKHHSKKELKAFFDACSRETTPITDAELSTYNDTIQQAYKAFAAFYKPHRLDSIGHPQWGYDTYKNVDFLIVQNTLKIYFTDKVFYSEEEIEKYIINEINQKYFDKDSTRIRMLERLKNNNGTINRLYLEFYSPYSHEKLQNGILTDSIINFKPAIHCDEKIPLFLTETYKEILNAFLGSEFFPFQTGGFMNPARAKKESKNRQQFLENYVKIFHGHWGGYWELYSFPRVFSLIFDKNMEYAIINFKMIYEGGYARLKREGEEWILIESKLTWIE
jgi:hypothetical protein